MRIIITPSEVWDFFQGHKGDSLCEMIAENPEYGIEVWLSDRDGDPDFQVMADDDIIFEDYAYGSEDCRETCELIYGEYLTSKVVDMILDDDVFSDQHVEELNIEDRETELDAAVFDFLETVLEDDPCTVITDIEEVFNDIKDHMLEYLARKHDLSIRRPMYLEDEDGEDFYADYPYECMVYEDEDNPIYK